MPIGSKTKSSLAHFARRPSAMMPSSRHILLWRLSLSSPDLRRTRVCTNQPTNRCRPKEPFPAQPYADAHTHQYIAHMRTQTKVNLPFDEQ